MVENYDNLDFRVNLLYDAVYNKNTIDDFEVEPIVLSNIRLIDVKLPEYANLSSVFDGKFTYTGKHNDYWEFRRQSDKSYSTLFLAKPYSGNNSNDMGSGEIYNATMHYVLSELAFTKGLKHIMLPLMFFDTTLDKLQDKMKLPEDQRSDNNKVSVLVLEKYFKMVSLEEFLESGFETSNLEYWKVLIFQLLYTLYEITERLGNFRHNHLGLDAIRVYRKTGMGNTKYVVGNTTYSIPKLGFEIKLGDFEQAYTSNHIRNKNAPHTIENPYYDIHYFLNSIYIFLKQKKISIPPGLMSFIREIIPEHFLSTEDFTGLDETEYFKLGSTITPKTLLKNTFFDSFIVDTMKLELSASPMNTKNHSEEHRSFPTRRSFGGKDRNTTTSITEAEDTEMRMLARIDNNKKKIKSDEDYSSMSSDSSSVFSEAENRSRRNRRSLSSSHKSLDSTSVVESEYTGGRSSRVSDSDSGVSDVLRTTYNRTDTHADTSSNSSDSDDVLHFSGGARRHKKVSHKKKVYDSDSDDRRLRNTVASDVLGKDVSKILKKLPPTHIQEVPQHILDRINAHQGSQGARPRAPAPMGAMGLMPGMGPGYGMMPGMGMGMMPQMGGGCMTGGAEPAARYVFMKDGQPVQYAPKDFFFRNVVANQAAQS